MEQHLQIILTGYIKRKTFDDLTRYFYSKGIKFKDDILKEDFFYQCRESIKSFYSSNIIDDNKGINLMDIWKENNKYNYSKTKLANFSLTELITCTIYNHSVETIINALDEAELKLKNNQVEKSINQDQIINPHSKIFTDFGFEVFEHFRSNVKEKSQSAEFGFLFDRMQNESLIHDTISRKYFYDFLIENFDLKHLSDKLSSKYSSSQYQSKYALSKLAVKTNNKQ